METGNIDPMETQLKLAEVVEVMKTVATESVDSTDLG